MSQVACTSRQPETQEKVEVVPQEDEKEVQRIFQPGEIVPDSIITPEREASFFQDIDIPDTIFALMQGKSYKSDCNVPRSDLRYLLCLHRDIHGRSVVGEMVVNKQISATVLQIFHDLYKAEYPIERMRLVDYYDADDEQTMLDNNTSCFNFRYISHTSTVSKHGLGLAIDINPLYNPYHRFLRNGKEIVEPATAAPYLDRSKTFPYKIEKHDLCYRLFKDNGFSWGGNWSGTKDYQHFEK